METSFTCFLQNSLSATFNLLNTLAHRDAEKCAMCESILLDKSTALPCDHRICGKCVAETRHDKSLHRCPKCKRDIDDDFEYTALVHERMNRYVACWLNIQAQYSTSKKI